MYILCKYLLVFSLLLLLLLVLLFVRKEARTFYLSNDIRNVLRYCFHFQQLDKTRFYNVEHIEICPTKFQNQYRIYEMLYIHLSVYYIIINTSQFLFCTTNYASSLRKGKKFVPYNFMLRKINRLC